MSNHRKPLVLSFALLCSSGLAAQSTWIVDPTGAGNFTSITQANAAASPGDTLVLVGTMPGGDLTKPLHVVAQGATVTSLLHLSTSGPVSIAGGTFLSVIALGTTASIDGISGSLSAQTGSNVVARSCTLQNGAWSQIGVWVAADATVILDDCALRGRDAYALFGSLPSSPGLFVNGHAELRRCTIAGGLPAGWVHGCAAIHLDHGTVELRDCTLTSGAPAPLVSGTGTVLTENTLTGGATPTPATIVVTPGSLPWTTGTSAAPGGTIHVAVDGPAGTLAAMSVSLGMRAPFASPFGDVWLDPLGMVPLVAGITDAAGALPTSIVLPSPLQRGLQLSCQSVVFLPNAIVATAPAVLQLL